MKILSNDGAGRSAGCLLAKALGVTNLRNAETLHWCDFGLSAEAGLSVGERRACTGHACSPTDDTVSHFTVTICHVPSPFRIAQLLSVSGGSVRVAVGVT